MQYERADMIDFDENFSEDDSKQNNSNKNAAQMQANPIETQ